ncbi:MAG TPA: response regulator transcription factor [Gemmatimonadaceae bacterium]|jgi:two-component system copper resistance phosphate regulon response regulator CusR|nr:response regulator transcription factor [Gemmatimonadaceae bacterium]
MRILIVEDDTVIASSLAKGLREESYAVDVAADGDAAVFNAAVTPYDAIILDVMLPRRDGFAVVRELRRRGMTTPVLMLTARDGVPDRITGLDLGADDYVIKPFVFAELLARLRALLRRAPNLTPRVLRIGDLELDTHAQLATRAGENISLTTREYALLEYLARNAGRVVGRAEISDHVWDDNYDPASNLIESYINRLRKKLDVRGLPQLIQTRRGAGYVIEAASG